MDGTVNAYSPFCSATHGDDSLCRQDLCVWRSRYAVLSPSSELETYAVLNSCHHLCVHVLPLPAVSACSLTCVRLSADAGRFNDLHEYDIATATWTDLTPTSGFIPSQTSGLAMIESGGKIYVFGGYATTGMLSSPPCLKRILCWVTAIAGICVLYLPALIASSLTVVRLSAYSGGYSNDLLSFDIESGTWTDLSATTSGTAPSVRDNPGMAESRGKIYVFGGYTSSCPLPFP